MNIIETQQLSRRFRQTEAVNDLNLAVPAGSIFALLGPNGAGKSTTIKMLMNLLEPSSGVARVLGADTRRLGPAELRRIGYVSENMELPEWMSVEVFLDYCRGFYPAWDQALEKSLREKFELPADRKIKHLSRGMRMKAALVAALAYRPALLVLDEPFSGLDPVVRDDFIRGLLEATAAGEWTIFLSSHDMEEVERLADWVGLIDQGRLKLTEKMDSLQSRFRRVDVTRTGAAAPGPRPASWLEYEEAGALARFVESQYVEGATEQQCRDVFPGATVAVRPMPLREIYVTLARAKTEPKEQAS